MARTDANGGHGCPYELDHPGRNTTFTPVYDWLARRRELSWPAKFLFSRLWRYAGRRISAAPTQAALAAEMGLSITQLKAHLQTLTRKHDGVPLVWVMQGGRSRVTRYVFPVHPWRQCGIVDNSRARISSQPENRRANPLASRNPGELGDRAINGHARAVVGDNNNRRQSSASPAGGAARRGQVFTDRGSRTGQQRIGKLLQGIGTKI